MVITLITLIPSIVIFFYIRQKDSYWKEKPKKLIQDIVVLMVTLLTVNILADIIFEMSIFKLFMTPFPEESKMYNFAHNFISIALPEELLKYVVLLLTTWKSPAFSHKFDGIVFAVLSSLAFATEENLIYMTSHTTSIMILRAVMTVPFHATNGVFMGIFYTKAKQASLQNQKRSMFLNLLISLLLPVILHGFYDFFVLGITDTAVKVLASMMFAAGEIGMAIYFICKESKNNAFLIEPQEIETSFEI